METERGKNMQGIEEMRSTEPRYWWLNDRLWALTLAPESALVPSRWRKLLRREVEALLALLSERFASEEARGHLACVARVRPALQPQVTLLAQQHADILAGLDAVQAGLRDGHDVATSQARLRALLALWRAHEHAEHDLLAEALVRDSGGFESANARAGGKP